MATLVLGTLGTLLGGPIGGAIGALAGRQIDNEIFNPPAQEGPHLKELAITTSSYGTPIAKHFGRTRIAGTIIWATELQESSEANGGGKGGPKTTEYSYSTSFAVALASRPIEGIGRIWADGNLLRGAAGDLKTAGQLRIYNGYGDQQVDPLISSAVGASCIAFRNCAYAVFEDLQLADFGNRIPALSFEVIADNNRPSLSTILSELDVPIQSTVSFDKLSGISYKGGPVTNTLRTLNAVYPSSINSDQDELRFDTANVHQSPILMPDASGRSADPDNFGAEDGRRFERADRKNRLPLAIRYYDTERDYQPGIQRAEGRAALPNESVLEFPGALKPIDAKALIGETKKRAQWESETIQWRTTELNPEIRPGTLVKLPEIAGYWLVEDWEWRDKGVELGLRRLNPLSQPAINADSGSIISPPDDAISATIVKALELPWDGTTAANSRQIYAAVGSSGAGWKGASLYSNQPRGLIPLGVSTRKYAGIGSLTNSLGPSSAHHFEPSSMCDLEFATKHAGLVSADLNGIAAGQNKLMIGREIIQFASAEQISETNWRLTGLLRGRAGTEAQAALGHAIDEGFVVLDHNLSAISSASRHASTRGVISAIGIGDDQPVSSAILSTGNSNLPLNPVHARGECRPDGSFHMCWVRRSRGAWNWLNGTVTPLNEESELYRIAIGDPENPAEFWEVEVPETSLSASQIGLHAGQNVWVRQIGSHGPSESTLIALLP